MTADWWRNAVIYQIYPLSFSDGNDDGYGDLRGITDRLDYVANLGVDAIWISPFFVSPLADHGYDIADYRNVDPVFGTLADFDTLLTRAHHLGLKVIVDMVWGHTSSRHPWFDESRRAAEGPKSDWYVWSDPQPDGTPPNNWLSVFGGPAWSWDDVRSQYYLHHFLPSQPKLNLRNPAVLEELLSVGAYWLDRGVDGFRFDAVDFLVHDDRLRDNPARPDAGRPIQPFDMQLHRFDIAHRETATALARIRALCDRDPAVVSVGEVGRSVGDDNSLERAANYMGGGQGLHAAYSLHITMLDGSATSLRTAIVDVERLFKGPGFVWSFSNHDVPRVATRWGAGSPAAARMYLALLLTLKGAICLYQGEELGLPEAELPFDALRDPYGLNHWPAFKGRDGCRTPMPWRSDAANAGFSTASRTWLPFCESHRRLAVDRQECDSCSPLSFCRNLLRLRKQHPALRDGALSLRDAQPPILMFERRGGGERVCCLFNMSDDPVSTEIPGSSHARLEWSGTDVVVENERVLLPPYGVYLASIADDPI